MKKYLLTFLLFSILATGALFNFIKQSQDKKNEPTLENYPGYCKIVIPEADTCLKHTDTIPHFRAFSKNPKTERNELIGIAFITTETAPRITGYAGKIKMIVGIDLQGNITKAHIISHAETPRFVRKINGFMRQFTNKDIRDPFLIRNDINIMTRATITSRAITRAIKESIDKTATELLDIKMIKKKENTTFPIVDIFIPTILFILAICGLLLKEKNLRILALTGSFIYLGIIKASMLSIIQITNIGLWQVPSWESNPLWFMLMGLTLLTLIFWGNIYCSSICPFCSIQEIIGKLFSKIPLRKIKASPAAIQLGQKGRYWILFLAIILSYLIGSSDFLGIEPFVILFSPNSSFLGWFLVGFMILLSLLHYKFWCKYLCPVGSFNKLILKIKFSKSKQSAKKQVHQKKLTKNDTTFIIILVTSYILLFGIFIENILIEPAANEPTKNITEIETTIQKPPIDVEEVRSKLKNAGINPREAKYWEEIK